MASLGAVHGITAIGKNERDISTHRHVIRKRNLVKDKYMKRIIFVIVVLAVLMGSQTINKPQAHISANPAQNGRFQIVINPNVSADTFLLDTQTGRTWTPHTILDVKGKPSIWKYQERIDDEQQFSEWASRQTFADPEK